MSTVHGLPSLVHTVPAGWNRFGGQSAEVPVHVSATSHGPTASRQTVVAGLNAFGGHSPELPVHVSATSQGPSAGRQTVVTGLNAFGGHSIEVPVQTSGRSQGPAAARQTAPAFAGTRSQLRVVGLQTLIAHGLFVWHFGMHLPPQNSWPDGHALSTDSQWPVLSQKPPQHSALDRQLAPMSRHWPCALQFGRAAGQTHSNVSVLQTFRQQSALARQLAPMSRQLLLPELHVTPTGHRHFDVNWSQ